MWKLPSITPRSGRVLIALLLCIKLVLLVWNAAVFDGRTDDADYHAERALSGGLKPSATGYDPPLYYLPALLAKRAVDAALPEHGSEPNAGPVAALSRRERATPAARAERAFRERLLTLLRYSNVAWLGLFYVAWIGYAFPRLLGGFQGWFLASLLLLALPGYQKLAVMSHPDNAFAGCAALAICAWLFVRERWQRSATPPASVEADAAAPRTAYGAKPLFGFALAIGLLALTRPFAVVPVAVLALVAVVYALRLSGARLRELLPRLALILALVIGSTTSWYVYRWKSCGEPTRIFPAPDRAPVGQSPSNVSFREYYATFKVRDLVDPPTRKPARRGRAALVEAPSTSSFFTVLYSEIWGDQWLYFSGARQRDVKGWPKRLSMACALLVPPIVAGLGGLVLWDLFRRARDELRRLSGRRRGQVLLELAATFEQELVLLTIAGLGAALFVYWQAGPALLPDESSSLKFIHIATLFPPLLALAFARRMERDSFSLLAGYFLLVYIAAFPLAMYWPS